MADEKLLKSPNSYISFLKQHPNSELVTEYVAAISTPQLKTQVRKSDLLTLVSSPNKHLNISLLVNFHDLFSREELYFYALSGQNVRLAFAKTPSLWKKLSNEQWLTLIKVDINIAKIALSSRNWSITNHLSSSDLRDLACKDKEVAKIIFDRFSKSKQGIFSGKTLELQHWQEIAMSSKEIAKTILESHIGKRFSPDQVSEIKKVNALEKSSNEIRAPLILD